VDSTVASIGRCPNACGIGRKGFRGVAVGQYGIDEWMSGTKFTKCDLVRGRLPSLVHGLVAQAPEDPHHLWWRSRVEFRRGLHSAGSCGISLGVPTCCVSSCGELDEF